MWVDHCARGWGQVFGAECHLREGSDHRDTAVPCEGHRMGEGAGAPRLSQPFFDPCVVVPLMVFPYIHSTLSFEIHR